MIGISLCPVGMEDLLKKELLSFSLEPQSLLKGGYTFSGEIQQIATFTYYSQLSHYVGLVVEDKEYSGKDRDLSVCAETLKNTELYKEGEQFSFTVRVAEGSEVEDKGEILKKLSKEIKEAVSMTPTFKEARYRYGVFIQENRSILFLSVVKGDLFKRQYKVFPHKNSLRGSVAFGLTQIAQISEGERVLDPYCRSGEVVIELAHHVTGKSIHHYTKDTLLFSALGFSVELGNSSQKEETKKLSLYSLDTTMANVKAAEKNSKIAGVHKLISFGRVSTEDLDLKFDHVIDVIVTQFPAHGKERETQSIQMLKEFFKQCNLVLSRKGRVCLAGSNLSHCVALAQEEKLYLREKRSVMQGKEQLEIYYFTKVLPKKKRVAKPKAE